MKRYVSENDRFLLVTTNTTMIKNHRTQLLSDRFRSLNREIKFDDDEEEEPRWIFGVSSRQKGQKEHTPLTNVRRKKDYICFERVKGKYVNILDGLELHCNVFSPPEQRQIVNFVSHLQEEGYSGRLTSRTFAAPPKWIRGKGRVTIQFGCYYNYARDKYGNPPGILQLELADPIPLLFKDMIKRLVDWHVLPSTCVPDSCIVNIYDEGDCIPPHIDHHDFHRPFCTVSFLSECNIVFGTRLIVEGDGEFSGAYEISLPVGSVLVLKGNGADVAKHCVPAVPTKRISITFRKMRESKNPARFVPEPDLQIREQLVYESYNPRGRSNLYKPIRPSKRKFTRRDDITDGSRGYSQPWRQTRKQGSSFANGRRTRLEY